MIQENVQILWNQQVSDTCFRIGLSSDPGYANARPGQFVMLRTSEQWPPLLRRPFSIYNRLTENGRVTGIEIMYKVVGQGTRNLSVLKKGDHIDMLGPLGNGFKVPDNCRRLFIAAGGIGVAPLYFLTSCIKENKAQIFSGCEVFFGARTQDELVGEEDFADLGVRLHIATDDGTKGFHGFATDLLDKHMEDCPPDLICACGPEDMLKRVGMLAEKCDTPCQVSIETFMACGMGACLGCAVEKREHTGSYWHACMDGPVLDAHKLKFNDHG